MDNILKYKDFIGTVNFSAEDGVFYGKIEGIKSMVSFARLDTTSKKTSKMPLMTILNIANDTKSRRINPIQAKLA